MTATACAALKRVENWPALLANFVEQHRHTPFAWREWDCCSMAAAWVQCCTGVDVFGACSIKYAPTMRSALRKTIKADGLKPLVDAALGASVAPAFAQRGDIVLLDLDGRESLAVCLGAVAAGAGVAGMEFVGQGAWTCAWRI